MTHVHFVGIGGTGLSAIARVMLESGYTVTGSDQSLSPLARELQRAGVTVDVGHDARHVSGADWVVRSSAITDDNPEVQAATRLGIPVYKRADLLGKLMAGKTGIAIAGTHGKTTTTAMIAWVLTRLGQDPTFIIGSVALNLGVNARAGQGKHFVIEADEYDKMFLGLRPHIEVLTNLEHDHPDCYPTFDSMRVAFEAFSLLLPADGVLIACTDDAGARGVLRYAASRGRSVIAYGTARAEDKHDSKRVQATAIRSNPGGGCSFVAMSNIAEVQQLQVELQVPGEHNVRNALAVLAVICVLGLPLEPAGRALAEYSGTSRRFEVRGEAGGVTVIDDYAHHPTEIRAALAAARGRYGSRTIWAVWQPHTYSRAKLLLREFAQAFSEADHVLVTDVYGSREAEQDFSSAEVVDRMAHPDARYSGSLESTVQQLLKGLRAGDVLLVLSAGDADQISDRILKGA